MPTILSYAAQPYDNLTYHLANSLGIMANPIFCLIQFFIQVKRTRTFVALTFLAALFVSYVFILALRNKNPLLNNSAIGSVFCVSLHLFQCFLLQRYPFFQEFSIDLEKLVKLVQRFRARLMQISIGAQIVRVTLHTTMMLQIYCFLLLPMPKPRFHTFTYLTLS